MDAFNWLQRLVLRIVLDGPTLPGNLAPRLFNWAMSDYHPTRITDQESAHE